MRTAAWPDHNHVYESMCRRGMNLTKRYWMFLTICQAASTPRPDLGPGRQFRSDRPEMISNSSAEQ
jgi:hypothetical protein